MTAPDAQEPRPATAEAAGAPLTVEFGARRLSARQAGELRVGTVLELDADQAGPVRVCLAGRPVARGRVVRCEGQLAVCVERRIETEVRT